MNIVLNRETAALKALLTVAVIVASYGPVAMTIRASVAAPAGEAGNPADPRSGEPTDARPSGYDEFDTRPLSTDGAPALHKIFGAGSGPGPSAGISLPVNGVPFAFDSAVARSYVLQRVANAGGEGDDLPSNAESSDFSQSVKKTAKANPSFNEHMKSVSESGFLAANAAQISEWDRQEFVLPEWVAAMRQAVRDDGPAQPTSTTSHPDAPDNMNLIKQGLNVYMTIQNRLKALDPLTLCLIGIVIGPFALIFFALKTHHISMPAGRARRRKIRQSAPVEPVRTRRKRSRTLRVRTAARS